MRETLQIFPKVRRTKYISAHHNSHQATVDQCTVTNPAYAHRRNTEHIPFTKIIPTKTLSTFPAMDITMACGVNPKPSAKLLKGVKYQHRDNG